MLYFIASLVVLALYAPSHAIVTAYGKLRDSVSPQ